MQLNEIYNLPIARNHKNSFGQLEKANKKSNWIWDFSIKKKQLILLAYFKQEKEANETIVN